MFRIPIRKHTDPSDDFCKFQKNFSISPYVNTRYLHFMLFPVDCYQNIPPSVVWFKEDVFIWTTTVSPRLKLFQNSNIFKHAQFFLEKIKKKRDEGEGRILFGDNKSGGKVMLRPISLQSTGVRILARLSYIYSNLTCAWQLRS